MKTARDALTFVSRHRIVLEAGRGPVPSLADEIAGEAIRGSWWGHPKGKLIFRLTRAVRDSDDVVVCRMVNGKITYVHRSAWPAVVRLATLFRRSQLDALHEVHTPSGKHVLTTTPFPGWVSGETSKEAELLSAAEAAQALGDWFARVGAARR